MKFYHIIFLIVGLFILTSTVSASNVSLPDTIQYTSAKELDSMTIDHKELYELALHNIIEAKLDKERVATYKWYKSIVPLYWSLKLSLWMDKYYPHLKWAKNH